MNKTLILADFDASALFLKQLAQRKETSVLIISADERMFAPVSLVASSNIMAMQEQPNYASRALSAELASSNFTGVCLDPCNEALLAEYLKDEFSTIYILLSDERSVRLAYNAVRSKLANTSVVLCSNDPAYSNDAFCSAFSPKMMLAARLIDELPSAPHIARYIGLGEGEIMQVQVPSGSVFANKHIHAITQKDYKIALIYRQGKVILPKPQFLINAGDELLLVGKPERLRKIFARVRASVGQFPNPYASDIAVIINMKIERKIQELVNAAILMLAKTAAKKCHFYVLNASLGKELELLKSMRRASINVHFIYEAISEAKLLAQISERSRFLFICGAEFFERNKQSFYELSMPVFRLGRKDFSRINKILALSQNGSGVEELTSVLLDFGGLFDIASEIYLYDNGISAKRLQGLHEHIDQQMKFFERKMELRIFSKENPLFKVANEPDSICVAGLAKELALTSSLDKYFLRFFKPALNENYQTLSENHILFVPIS